MIPIDIEKFKLLVDNVPDKGVVSLTYYQARALQLSHELMAIKILELYAALRDKK